jgi:hypothetical protein
MTVEFTIEDQARLTALEIDAARIMRKDTRALEDHERFQAICAEVRALIAKQQSMLAEIAGLPAEGEA